MTSVLIRKQPCEGTSRHVGRTPCGDEVRNRSHSAANQGALKTANKPPEARKGRGKNPLQVSERQPLAFELQHSRTMRQYISIVLSHIVCGTLLWPIKGRANTDGKGE